MILYLFLDTDDRRFFSEEARSAIREACGAAEPEIRALLPRLAPTLEVAVQTGTFVIPETVEVGAAVAPARVTWTVDPTRPGGVAAIARSRLRLTLFHECHHLVRFAHLRKRDTRPTLMDRVVSEGLATAFERDLGGWRPPWGEYPEDVLAWAKELLKLPASEPPDPWMFQHPDGRRWVGYRAGTYIADRAIAESGRSAAELVLTPTDEILRIARVDDSA